MYALLVILILLTAVVLVVAGFVVATTSHDIPRSVSVTFFIIAASAIGGGIWSTYYYDYFPNENTHMHGWPVPYVVFQRDNSDSQWLDFVGPTTLLALPLNWLLFLLPPSFSILIFNVIKKRKKEKASL